MLLMKKTIHLLRTVTLFLLCMTPVSAWSAAQGVADAEKAWRQKDYDKAAAIYESLKDSALADDNRAGAESISDLYYNLGNCYYRMNKWGEAVLNYRRALAADPGNADAGYNLELVGTKITDRFDAPSEMFFVSWMKRLVSSVGSTVWGYRGIAFFLALFLLSLVWALARKVWLRRVGAGGMPVMALLFVLCETFAFVRYRIENGQQTAVVLKTIDTFGTPSVSAQKMQPLHEGTTVKVLETFRKEWMKVELPDGKTIWVRQGDIVIV